MLDRFNALYNKIIAEQVEAIKKITVKFEKYTPARPTTGKLRGKDVKLTRK